MNIDSKLQAWLFKSLGSRAYQFLEASAIASYLKQVAEKSSANSAQFHASLEELTQFYAKSLQGSKTIAAACSHEIRNQLIHLVKLLIPWRKGPYAFTFTFSNLQASKESPGSEKKDRSHATCQETQAQALPYPYHIESEWQSQLKWESMYQHLQKRLNRKTFNGMHIADIGGNNGYFSFRLAEAGADSVLLLEPTSLYFKQFTLLSWLRQAGMFIWPESSATSPAIHASFAHPQPLPQPLSQPLHVATATKAGAGTEASGCDKKIFFSQLGYQALEYFHKSFDILLLLGILYHHENPEGILALAKKALKNNGLLVVDCQIIDATPPQDPSKNISEKKLPYILYPGVRYTGKRGFHYLPSQEALLLWLQRSGFQDIKVFHNEYLHPTEQRRTKHAPLPSLREGLQSSPAKNLAKGNIQNQGFSSNTEEASASVSQEGYPPPKRLYVSARPYRDRG